MKCRSIQSDLHLSHTQFEVLQGQRGIYAIFFTIASMSIMHVSLINKSSKGKCAKVKATATDDDGSFMTLEDLKAIKASRRESAGQG